MMQSTTQNHNQGLLEGLELCIRPHAKYKQRSYETSKSTHLPLLESHPSEPSIVLFGDSTIERMTTTGAAPNLDPWPSSAMVDDKTLGRLSKTSGRNMNRLSGVLNAGVGGDRIENMIYRLIGDKDEARELRGLAEVLQSRNIKLWVVSAGTNNLHRKKGLVEADIDKIWLLLLALLEVSSPSTKMLFSGLTYRTDIPDPLVDEANGKISMLIKIMNRDFGFERIEYLPPLAGLDKNQHLADPVHLNEAGYQVWAEVLAPRVMELYESISLNREHS